MNRTVRMARTGRGFTVIELLVVLTIMMVLFAIALPQYRSTRLRSMVTVAQANLRSTTQGLELYAADHYRFPNPRPDIPSDPLALLSDHQLSVLTTPVSYISPDSLHDPFGVVEPRVVKLGATGGNDFPRITQPNARQSLLYFHYPTLSRRLQAPSVDIDGASVISIGPDQQDSFGTYRPFDVGFFESHFSGFGIHHPYDTVYNPTNGTRSPGDIGGYAGEARRFRMP